MRLASILAGIVLTIASLTAPAVAGQQPAPPETDERPTHPECNPHPPIEITENRGPNGFALAHVPTTGIAVPRPGSGVVDGNGTAENPYVIENWCIQHQLPEADASPEQTRDAIKISGTDAHVVIRDVVIETAFGQEGTVDRGIVLQNADNVRIENTLVDDTTKVSVAGEQIARLDGNLNIAGNVGIAIDGSSHVTVDGSRVDSTFTDGFRIEGSEDVSLSENNVIGTFILSGVKVTDSDEVTLEDNKIRAALLAGLTVRRSPDVAVTDNDIQGNTGGVLGLNSPRLTLENNQLGNQFYAATLAGTPNALVTQNGMNGNEAVGLALADASGTTVTANNLTNNGFGIRIEQGQGYEVHQNNIVDNAKDGLRAVDVDATVDATNNWWGCPGGPTQHACDSVQGDVRFDPFLTEPNLDAGTE